VLLNSDASQPKLEEVNIYCCPQNRDTALYAKSIEWTKHYTLNDIEYYLKRLKLYGRNTCVSLYPKNIVDKRIKYNLKKRTEAIEGNEKQWRHMYYRLSACHICQNDRLELVQGNKGYWVPFE
jgi:hypothetical protein